MTKANIIIDLELTILFNRAQSVKFPVGSETRGFHNGVANQANVTLNQLNE